MAYIARGPDGRPCIAFLPAMQLQPCQQAYDLRQLLKDVSLVLAVPVRFSLASGGGTLDLSRPRVRRFSGR